jgi:succinoglycan biosynthesis transport protein ExoP
MDAGSDLQAAVARIVDPAVVTTIPVRPNKGQIILVAFVLGLMIGAMGAVLLERMDNTIKGSESAEVKLQQPVLAVLPALSGAALDNVATMFIREPNSHHAEAIRTARTGIQLSDVDQRHRLIVVTSSVPAEGKTSTSINLALALAQTKRTLLIDADMRRPQVGTRLGLTAGAKGLSNLVTGSSTLKECVHPVEGSSLLVMPSGDIPPNPLDLLVSQRFKDVLRHLQPQLDFIIIDTPPVELVSDAIAVAPMATSTIYVVRATETPVPVIRKGLNRLQRSGANIMGVIVNGLDFEDAQRYYGESVNGGYGNTYYHGYSQQSKA